MKRILEHFRAITAIPRCSYHADKMKEYIKNFALSLNYEVHVDHAGNILCHKGAPKLCLQAHYDMVCIGDTQSIEIIMDETLLKAKNSTLGADNGMGMAIMFWAMEQNDHLECLFTSDEEVGLIGAMQFQSPLKSSCLLNLDAEEEGEIYIGCAGGVDVIASLPLQYIPLGEHVKLYEISAFDFIGGHSGVDIDKKIPSAIKALGYELLKHDVFLVHLQGGERRNAIPKSATAIVASKVPLHVEDSRLQVKALKEGSYTKCIAQSNAIIKAIGAFAQGIREWDRTLDIPSMSINLGVISTLNDVVRMDCAARAMDDENLAILTHESTAFFKALGFEITQEGWHGAWKPEITSFALMVQEAMQTIYTHVTFKAIHAGLECGELILRQAKRVETVSIGPTIRYPHSLREECDMNSVRNTASIVQKIINTCKD